MKHIAYRIAVLVVLIAGGGLCARQQTSGRHSPDETRKNGWSELTASAERMHAAMGSVGPSGNSDIDFVRLMLPHHQAAIDMAKTQLMSGKDPEIRRLAQEIITDQQSEIELMQLWLKRRESHQ
jgi:uncharacterized protein (DUF305 family)